MIDPQMIDLRPQHRRAGIRMVRGMWEAYSVAEPTPEARAMPLIHFNPVDRNGQPMTQVVASSDLNQYRGTDVTAFELEQFAKEATDAARELRNRTNAKMRRDR